MGFDERPAHRGDYFFSLVRGLIFGRHTGEPSIFFSMSVSFRFVSARFVRSLLRVANCSESRGVGVVFGHVVLVLLDRVLESLLDRFIFSCDLRNDRWSFGTESRQ